MKRYVPLLFEKKVNKKAYDFIVKNLGKELESIRKANKEINEDLSDIEDSLKQKFSVSDYIYSIEKSNVSPYTDAGKKYETGTLEIKLPPSFFLTDKAEKATLATVKKILDNVMVKTFDPKVRKYDEETSIIVLDYEYVKGKTVL